MPVATTILAIRLRRRTVFSVICQFAFGLVSAQITNSEQNSFRLRRAINDKMHGLEQTVRCVSITSALAARLRPNYKA